VAECRASVQRLQHALGQPAQREWVLTCGPVPHLPHPTAAGHAISSTAAGAAAAAAALNPGSLQGRPQGSARRLRPAVAAAVAAAVAGRGGGGRVGSSGGSLGGGGGGTVAPVPPSRLYVEEADGEMRLATVLVSQSGR
jgi:hypothetical protein